MNDDIKIRRCDVNLANPTLASNFHSTYVSVIASAVRQTPDRCPPVLQVSKESLTERSLKMLVLDIDPLKRHLPIGTVEFPLSDYVRCKKNRLTVWRDLKQDSAQV